MIMLQIWPIEILSILLRPLLWEMVIKKCFSVDNWICHEKNNVDDDQSMCFQWNEKIYIWNYIFFLVWRVPKLLGYLFQGVILYISYKSRKSQSPWRLICYSEFRPGKPEKSKLAVKSHGKIDLCTWMKQNHSIKPWRKAFWGHFIMD